jgi:hypothetical protein
MDGKHATELDTLPFQPNERQREYLRACLDPSVEPNVEARCHAAGVARQSYYTWTRQPGFLEWVHHEQRRATDAEVEDVLAAIAQRAKAGSVEHARLFLRVAGLIDRQRGDTGRPAQRVPFVFSVPRPDK